jgi:hypothetical protein
MPAMQPPRGRPDAGHDAGPARPIGNPMVTARAPMTRAVAAALREAKPEKLDAGAVQLARKYAGLIDNAAVAAKYRKPLEAVRSALLGAHTLEAEDAIDSFNKIADALAEHSVASDLGPKLLATLTSLGLTPAGRGAKGGQNGVPVANPLDELKARRASRAERARQH